MAKQVEVFTDGSCLGNPGPGGYGIVLRYKQTEKNLSKGYHLTTNNRMEMMAAVVALKSLKEPCNVILTTDSQYVRMQLNYQNENSSECHHDVRYQVVYYYYTAIRTAI